MHSQSPAEFLLAAFGHWSLLHFCHVHGWSLHVTQELLPGRLPWPLGQEVQVAAPAAEYLPAGQDVQAPPAAEYVPAGHCLQLFPLETEYSPAPQGSQALIVPRPIL